MLGAGAMRHTKTKAERLLRAVEKREARDAKRALRRRLRAERRAARQVSTGADPTV
jgi:hypothetical protein